MVEKKDIIKIYGVPEKVVYCKRCVISNQRPRISFDEEGICSACRFSERKKQLINWQDRESELVELCNQYRRTDGSYDVVVPCSGGKDGGRVAWRLKHEFGMTPLCVTWAPHVFTAVGWKNLQSFIESGFDHILVTPDGQLHRKMTRMALEEMGDPFQPFIFGQYSVPFRVANQYDIKLVFYGEDGEVEYGGSDETLDRPSVPWETFVKNRFSSVYTDSFAKWGIKEKDLKKYSLSPQELEQIEEKGIKQYFMSYFMKWVPQENYYEAVKNYNFEANDHGRSEGTYSRYASLDDQLDGFHFYLMFMKFGIGRATSDAAHEVRDGHISRDEAVALVRKYDGEFPKRYLNVFLDYCGISEEYLREVCDSWRGSHIWDKVDNEWVLKQQVS